MEEISNEEKEGLDILIRAASGPGTPAPHEMVVTGGQAANDSWNQMKCNKSNIRINLPSCTDAELIGDAVFAFTGMGVYKSIAEAASALCKVKKTYYPEENVSYSK